MLLVFDIGNTNITIALFEIGTQNTAKKIWRINTAKNQTADEFGVIILNLLSNAQIKIKDIKALAASSVVPSVNRAFEQLAQKYFHKKLFFVDDENCGDLKFSMKNHKGLGADRIADSVAACHYFGGSCIVIDFGTATTFDCIDAKGRYVGGSITLGPATAAQTLNLKTALLPLVEIKKNTKAIGITTQTQIQAGLFIGYIGMIKEILERTKKEMKTKTVIATGGFASAMGEQIEGINKICPNLTLDGIKIIWEKSRRKK